ncbi:tetratricopeptide repeat protein [Flavobacterium sp.]|uniref:tetratricopeptide repeat protein n=1 Tax=Flavobacterium sp. TaxID=239 RepID=UPI00391DDD1A
MNSTDYIYLLNKPYAINDRQFRELEPILEKYPYFQSARVLQLKHLYNLDSYQYNDALKKTAAYTQDRGVLFDFITTTQFTTIDNTLYDRKVAELLNMEVIDSEVVVVQPMVDPLQQSLLATIEKSGEVVPRGESQTAEALELGKPLPFNTEEKHSFQKWLQLSRFKPIERKEIPAESNPTDTAATRSKKLELIDKFIETNPKIPAISKESAPTAIAMETPDKSYLMTETLAKVYLEQKKYQRAIQAYEILILKYPEKSSFFADRIEEIKKLQQNNP